MLNSPDVSRIIFFTVLLSQYIRCNDKAAVSACMSLECLAHRLYHCTVSSVFVLTLFEQINDDDDDENLMVPSVAVPQIIVKISCIVLV